MVVVRSAEHLKLLNFIEFLKLFYLNFPNICYKHNETFDSPDRQPAKREGGRPGRGPPRGPVPDPRRGPLLMKFLVYQWNPNQMYGVPPESYMELGVPPES